MKYLKQFIKKTPLVFSLIIVAFSLALSAIPLKQIFLSFCSKQCAGYFQGVILQSFIGTLLLVLIFKLGFSKICGLGGPGSWREWWLLWPYAILILLCAIPFPSTIDTTRPVTILLYILVFLSTGVFEESLFRGMVLSAYLQKWGGTQKGIYFSVLLSSLFFSLTHIPDLVKEGTFVAMAPFLIPCFFTGVFFAAYTLRSKSLWLTMLLHGLGDITQNFGALTIGAKTELPRLIVTTTDWTEVIISVLVTLPLFIYSLFILRKVKPFNQN